MSTPVNHSNYQELIQRFLDGDTTIAEEKNLYAYFSRTDLPDDALKYREMFQWYASLPSLNESDATDATTTETPVKRQSLRSHWISVAASVALLVGLLSALLRFDHHAQAMSDPLLSYTSGYIIRNGVRISDPAVVFPAIENMERMLDVSAASVDEDIDRLSSDDQFTTSFDDDPEIASMIKAALQ